MKLKTTIALSMSLSSILYATNGDQLIGTGAKVRSMGGAGIALSHGAESALVNPALITSVSDTEINFGGTIFMADINTAISPNTQGQTIKSNADISVIPAVSIASQTGKNIYMGIGMWGTAGMGVDFRKNSGLFDMETTFQLMQFAAPIAYKINNLSIGFAPVLQYGSLDINYKIPDQNGNVHSIGYGQTQNMGFGASMGATYDFGNGLTIGAIYKSKINMTYDESISEAASNFGLALGNTIEQPAEVGLGIGYIFGKHSIALDYKNIQWGSARGYSDFNWENQNVFAVGYQYATDKWSARIGYNHGKSPVVLSDATTPEGATLDTFNLLGFPATAEDHFTLGGSYAFNKNFSADIAFVYSAEKIASSDLQATGRMEKIVNSHKESSATLQLNYIF